MKSFLVMLFSLSLVLQLTMSSQAKPLPEAAPANQLEEYVPILPPREGIRQNIEAYIKEHGHKAASVAVAVFQNQETILSMHYGMADIAGNLPSDQNTVYEWGSVTKLLTWVSVMQLAERGELALDDDVTKYLPDGFLSKLEYDQAVTFLHLMNHQGGWQETTLDIETEDSDEVLPLESALRRSEPPQIYEPGTTSAYSNWGCALAGFIVERISGMPFHEYVKRHIFIPLGMEHSALEPTLADNKWVYEQRRLLKCYYFDDNELEDQGECIRHILLYPAGMATGTLDDLVKFAKALLPDESGKSPLFGKAATLEQMLSPSLFYGDSGDPRVSHGFLNSRYGVNTIGHPGNTAGCTANLTLEPLSGRGVVVLANQTGEVTFTSGLMPLVFASPQRVEAESPQPIDALAGYYLSSRTFNAGPLRILRIVGPGAMLALMKSDAPDTLKLALTAGEARLVSPRILDVSGRRMFVYKDANGIIHLNNASTNYIKQSAAQFWSQLALVMLIPISVLYSLLVIFRKLHTFAVNKKKNNTVRVTGAEKYQTAVHIAIIVIGACFAHIITADSRTLASMWLPCSLAAIFALIPIGSLIAALLNRNSRLLNRRRKISFAVTAILGLLMTFNVIYWQLFYFWV